MVGHVTLPTTGSIERQREGIAKGKAAGRYRGRKPVALESQEEAIRLAALGMTKANIAQKLNFRNPDPVGIDVALF